MWEQLTSHTGWSAGPAPHSWAFIRRTHQQSSKSIVWKLCVEVGALLYYYFFLGDSASFFPLDGKSMRLHMFCTESAAVLPFFNLFCAHYIFTHLVSQASHKPEWCWPLFSHGKGKVWLKYLQRALDAEYIILWFGSSLKNEQQWDVSASISQRKIWNSFYTTWLWKDAGSNGWSQYSTLVQAQQH